MTWVTWAESPEAHILIDLFADHTAEEMKTAEGQRLIAAEFQFPVAEYSDRSQRPAIRENFKKLLEIRKRVDLIADNFPNNAEAQFQKAAALLKKYRKQNAIPEMRIARRFIECALAVGWSSDLKAQFATIYEFFDKYKDYFLSYTNKQAGITNTDFSKALYPETKALLRAYNTTANLLARQIVEHLSESLSGFYDKQQIELGDNIRDEIMRGANVALVFIQLVSRVMLTSQDEEHNWCFREYIAYKNDDVSASSLARERERLFIFLIAERPVQGRPGEAVRPFADLRDAYKPWHKHMLELATMNLERSSREKLKEQIEAIAQQIHEFRHSVLDTAVCDEFAADLAY